MDSHTNITHKYLNRVFFIVTCEHATCHIRPELASYVGINQEVLTSHRGWDPGALRIAFQWSEALMAPLMRGYQSRLLIDLNRSESNPDLFSQYSRNLPEPIRGSLLREYRYLYRKPCLDIIEQAVSFGYLVVHLSVHSFTPVLNGVERQVDIGILFDPCRPIENIISNSWITNSSDFLPHLRICANSPYEGVDDGFTTFLRTQFPPDSYVGIEVEFNQRFSDSEMLNQAKSLLQFANFLDLASRI